RGELLARARRGCEPRRDERKRSDEPPRVLACHLVTSGFTSTSGAAASVHHVLLVGPDDDARRALHMMLDRVGKHVSAVSELDVARSYLGNGHECDAVIVAGELALALVRAGGTPPVIAVVRPRDLTLSLALL